MTDVLATLPRHAAAAKVSIGERIGAGLVAALCLTILILAAGMNPDPSGSGTHTQVGLPPCGWAIAFGRPCPTCGMTTAFAHAAHLHPIRAFVTQPMGLVFAVGPAVGFWVALHVAITGSQLGRVCARMITPRRAWLLVSLLALAWAYKWMTWGGNA